MLATARAFRNETPPWHEEAAKMYEAAAKSMIANNEMNVNDVIEMAVKEYLLCNKWRDAVHVYEHVQIPYIESRQTRESLKAYRVAEIQTDIAKILEENNAFPDAIEAYTKVAAAQEARIGKSLIIQTKVKIAQLSTNAAVKQYDRAAQLYLECANLALKETLTSFSVNKYLFNACIAAFAAGNVEFVKSILTNVDNDPKYIMCKGTREMLLLRELVTAVDGNDMNTFQTLFEHSGVYPEVWYPTAVTTAVTSHA